MIVVLYTAEFVEELAIHTPSRVPLTLPPVQEFLRILNDSQGYFTIPILTLDIRGSLCLR